MQVRYINGSKKIDALILTEDEFRDKISFVKATLIGRELWQLTVVFHALHKLYAKAAFVKSPAFKPSDKNDEELIIKHVLEQNIRDDGTIETTADDYID